MYYIYHMISGLIHLIVMLPSAFLHHTLYKIGTKIRTQPKGSDFEACAVVTLTNISRLPAVSQVWKLVAWKPLRDFVLAVCRK